MIIEHDVSIQYDETIQDDEECIMCLENFDENDINKTKILFNHCTSVAIHFKCLHEWVYINRYSCIICREEISYGPMYDSLRQIALSQTRLRFYNLHTYLNQTPNNETSICEKRIIVFVIFFFLSFLAFICVIFLI